MVFKKMLRALGVSGATVDTVLRSPECRPGGQLHGQVQLAAGDGPVEIEHIALDLVTRVEVEHGDHEANQLTAFHRIQVAGPMTLQPGSRQSVPFQFQLPWETPVTHVYGQALRGMATGLRTELSIARALDKGDLDPVIVHPLPAQELILEAFSRLGFRFKGADLEAGRLRGVQQTLPFYQEIEFFPPQHARSINEVELTFVAGPHAMDVILEIDKRGGLFTGSHDLFGHLQVDYATAGQTDWAAQIDAWLRQIVDQRPHYGQPTGPGHYPGHPGGDHSHGHPYGPAGHEYGHAHHDDHHRRGPGMGGVVAGAAAGFLGGMLAEEAFEEIGEFFDGGED